jgi:formylmethanofuran dehydrogenase subunit C
VNGALVHTWQGTKTGREVKALEVLGRAVAYYDELAKEGRIYAHTAFFGGGNPAGMIIVTGDVDELRKIEMEEAYLQVLTEAALVADNFHAQLMGGGSADDSTEGITRYIETLGKLGIS